MLNTLKALYLNQTTGIVLCVTALFLVGNTLYLNTVRDAKAEALEETTSLLEQYQFQNGKQSNLHVLKPFQKPFSYGHLLKVALPHFKDAGQALHLQKVVLNDVEVIPVQTKRDHRKSAQNIEKRPQLSLIGAFKSTANLQAPYQKLNEIIEHIQGETGCQFSLSKSMIEIPDDELDKAASQAPFQFELTLQPETQPTCQKRYTGVEGES